MTAPLINDALAERLETVGLARGSYTVKPHDRLRKLIAQRMTESARDIPHFPLTMEICLDALLATRMSHNASEGAVRVSINDLIVRAAALALTDVPEANVSYAPEGMVHHIGVDVAVAVAVKGGIMTPIVRAAATKTVSAISAELRDLADRAQCFRLQPDEYSGGNITVSNLGMFGIASFGSILNPPQALILSVGAARKRPLLRNGELAEESFMAVTLTCDHRALDGATGAQWLQAFRVLLETPDRIFA
ncbi:MAG: pyruvate dehydrogenase complex dihydrolipoamide acetyltransferase [Sphingomonadales bacterium]|nr:pyruvate dehydrogenase complex dihydrolipoamide acetyltransferase [Sphingomonadales bacterium]